VDAQRRDVGFRVLGGPTTVVDIGGRRILMDPTFDQPGPHDYLTNIHCEPRVMVSSWRKRGCCDATREAQSFS
jgi:hypothetical protein